MDLTNLDLRVIFLVVAIVCFILATFALPKWAPRGGWVALGLAFFAASFWPA
jgi:hypothetical protein